MSITTIDGYGLYDLLHEAGFSEDYCRYITAQGAHESENFSSQIYIENYNPLGIKYFGQAEALGERNGYAFYKNVSECVADYLRIYRMYGVLSVANLKAFVKRLQDKGYFTAPFEEYYNGCLWFFKLYFPQGWTRQKMGGAGGTW